MACATCATISTVMLQKSTMHVDVFSGMEQTMRAVRLPLQGSNEHCGLRARGRGVALFSSHHGEQMQEKARTMTGGVVQKMRYALTEVMTTKNGMEYTVNKSRAICGGQRGSSRGDVPGLSSVSAGLRFCAQQRDRRWTCFGGSLSASGRSNFCAISRKEGSRMLPRVMTDWSTMTGCNRRRHKWNHCLLTRRGRMAAVTPRASWSTQVEFKEAHLANVEEVATQLWNLTVDISKLDIGKGYTKAGQYLQLKVGESKPAFLAIASPPSYAESGVLEFLVKDVEGTTSELLCDLSKGDKISLSPVLGKGFNMELLSPAESYPSVLLFATGSGISPIKALIESGFDALKRADVRLYYGAANSSSMAYQERFMSWRTSGVNIVPVFSEPDEDWDGAIGYVQHAYKKDKPIADPTKAGAVLCGQKEMTEDVISLLTVEGVQRDKVLMNF